jgi:hypothetical protein
MPPVQDVWFDGDVSFLERWFAEYGDNRLFEIEARVKDVSSDAFGAVMAKLVSAVPPVRTVTVDEADNRTRSRRSYPVTSSSAAATYMSKQQVERVDVTAGGVLVRFSLTKEVPIPAVAGFSPSLFRIKDRQSFDVDGVAFELTVVRSGATRVEAEAAVSPECELELEWTGHGRAQEASPDWWARNFQYKVLFAVRNVLLAG